MNDKTLRQMIIDELDFEPSINAAHIGVAVENGIATLNGHVSSYLEKTIAERVVGRVRGVRAIAEEIEIRYPDEKKTADDEIAERALRIINWYAVSPDTIQVKVEKGRVTLSGIVDWQYQRSAAEAAVRKLSGVVAVINLITLRARPQAPDVKQKIEDALKRDAALEAEKIHVSVAGDRVILDGKVHAWHERGLAERAAWSVPGVHSVEDRLTIG